MALRHIVEAQQFNKKTLQEIFIGADRLKEFLERRARLTILEGKILANLFYVKSTRTMLSFASAMKRLGGDVVETEGVEFFSSEHPEASLEDMIKVTGTFADVIALRHYRSGSAKRASQVSPVPVINAGDGPAQHPTQALIDLYCIEKARGGIDGASIVFIGDLMNSRTIRSLTYFLAKYSGIKISFVSPRVLHMKDDIKDYLVKHNVPYTESLDDPDEMRAISCEADILYITQIPRDHFGDRLDDYDEAARIFRMDGRLLTVLKKDACIMHPFPRAQELATEVDSDPRAMYFKQIEYGQLVRMSILCHVLNIPTD